MNTRFQPEEEVGGFIFLGLEANRLGHPEAGTSIPGKLRDG